MRKNPSVMLLIDTSRIFGREFFRGVTKYSRLHGPWIFHNTLPFFEKTTSTLPQFDTLDLDGLIVFTADRKILDRALKSNLPLVARGLKGHTPGVPNIISDNQEVGTRTAGYLLSLGLKHLAFCGYCGISWSEQREQGFRQAANLKDHMPEIYRQPKSREKRQWCQEKSILVDWLTSLSKPIGIMCANDDRGQLIIEACHTAGLRVPDDAAVIGVDNDEIICEQSNPPLSSIARNFEEAGYQAAELLEQVMAGKDVNDQTVVIRSTGVIERQSTNVLAIDDPDVVEAVRFIRSAAGAPLTVEDVLKTVAVSRRYLDQKFYREMGRSIHQEITRARIERIARLLLETPRSITRISYNLGFHGPDHLGHYFRRHQGMTPQEYRQRHGQKM